VLKFTVSWSAISYWNSKAGGPYGLDKNPKAKNKRIKRL